MKIGLDWLEDPAIIVESPTGYIYTNQTGGYSCNHPEIEGALMPICRGPRESLEGHFTGQKWNGWCCEGIDEETADFIDKNLLECSWLVDREKLKASMEAWIFVKDSVTGKKGVLTWANSD